MTPILATSEITPTQIGIAVSIAGVLLGFMVKFMSVKKDMTNEIVSAVLAKLYETNKGKEISPDPLNVRATHDAVTAPEFTYHKSQIWATVNGIKSDISSMRACVEKNAALREDNGKRLENVEKTLGDFNRSIGQLTQAVQDSNRGGRRS